jgi:histidine triad (HIT) family protein
MSAQDTIFGKIIRREIPADIVYEDAVCLAFRDINPQAPTHLLLIPKQPIAKLGDAGPEDREILGHLMVIAAQLGNRFGENFRLVINSGAGAGQEVFHLHLHILSGRRFTWPPG